MSGRKGLRGLIAVILTLCVLFSFIPWWDAQQVYANEEDNNRSGIRIDHRGATVKYQLGETGDLTDLSNDCVIPKTELEPENADAVSQVKIQITPQQDQVIKGIKVRKLKESGDEISYKPLTADNGSYSFTLTKDETNWADYELEILDWDDVLLDNQYRIIKSGSGDLSLSVNGQTGTWDERESSPRSFTVGNQISFSVAGEVYKVIVNQNDQEEKELTGTDKTYNYIPDNALGFELVVYSSEEQYAYDHCEPDYSQGEFWVEYQVRKDENDTQSTVTVDNTKVMASVSCEERTKLILEADTSSVDLTIQPAGGYHYDICAHECPTHESCQECQTLTEQVKTNGNKYSWSVSSEGENSCPVISFISDQPDPEEGDQGNGDQPSQDLAEKVKKIIENQRYAFGDWDEDADVDAEDLKLGMACQIFYPEFNDSNRNQDIRDTYGITKYSDLTNKITITEDSSKNLMAKDASGADRTIKGYTYTVALTPVSSREDLNVTASGTVYAFAFSDDSIYRQNNRGCVIAVTEKNGVETYHLRCATGSNPDIVKPVSGDSDEDKAIVVVGDFDVTYDAARGEYQRGVSIFGNGAGLDTLFSQEEDTSIVAYQGRNEMLLNDLGKELARVSSWEQIFSIFTFYQKDFTGVRVKGSGAEGNTPSWAFNQYPVYSTSSNPNGNHAAVAYFGNRTVTIEPVDNITGLNKQIVGINSVTPVDAIPEAAVAFTKVSDKQWKAEFKSDYYDNVKIKVVYKLSGGGTLDSYITIHRVGIDILCGNKGGGSDTMTLFHGTETGPSYKPENDFVIWGTYYYPTQADYSQLVDLYVTYTWADGSVTRKTVKNNASLNLEYHHDGSNDCASSDFILYDGARAASPVKIEAIAVASGFENSTTFSGAKFGAGKGVVWNNYYRNDN